MSKANGSGSSSEATAASKGASELKNKKSRISQADIPSISLEQAVRIAQAIWDDYAGKPTTPLNVAISLGLSPSSGGWRALCGASIAYGLTDGGYNAQSIALTELGRKIVSPRYDGEDAEAIKKAILSPKIMSDFLRQYNQAKFPRDEIAVNVIIGMGIPKERAANVLDMVKRNGEFASVLRQTKSGLFVDMDHLAVNSTTPIADEDDERDDGDDFPTPQSNQMERVKRFTEPVLNNKVFITHGRDTGILEQISKLVKLGGFDPIISVQRETVAKPVPEKVMDDMRQCSAAIIHVGSEITLFDKEGHEYPQINSNVLIEIGAAMALYRGKFILVVEDGVKLPSNLQGLYESRYSGSEISLDAGMRILEALRGLSG